MAASSQAGALLNRRSIQIKMVSLENSLIKRKKGDKAALKPLQALQDGARSGQLPGKLAGDGQQELRKGSLLPPARSSAGRAPLAWRGEGRSLLSCCLNTAEGTSKNPFPAPETLQ